MKITLLVSHIESSRPHLFKYADEYLENLNSLLDFKLSFGTIEEIKKEPYTLVLVSSGGTVQDFKDLLDETNGPFILLSTPFDNSLPCCLELKYCLNERGLKGEILYGSFEKIAQRLTKIDAAIRAVKKISVMNFGVIGAFEDQVSDFSANDLEEAVNAKISFIGMDELLKEIKLNQYQDNSSTLELKAKASSDFQRSEIERALYIYGAVKRLAERNHFDGIALRCFELLPTKSTGCLALAILNKEGIFAACEGDARTLVSMAILGTISKQSCFMANPCSVDIDAGTMTFAHCTLPLDMGKSYQLDTHFESGLSVAVKGNFSEGVFTVFKCRENLKQYSVRKGDFASNPYNSLNCRTQLELKIDNIDPFLEFPINNHQVICKGNYVEQTEEFFKWVQP